LIKVGRDLNYLMKIILLDCQNNYVERLNIFDNAKLQLFNILTTSLNVLYNYFDSPNKNIFRSS